MRSAGRAAVVTVVAADGDCRGGVDRHESGTSDRGARRAGEHVRNSNSGDGCPAPRLQSVGGPMKSGMGRTGEPSMSLCAELRDRDPYNQPQGAGAEEPKQR